MNFVERIKQGLNAIKEQQETKCVVVIDHPLMRIEGIVLRNEFKKKSGPPYPTLIAFLGIPYALPPTGERRFQVCFIVTESRSFKKTSGYRMGM